MQITSFTPIIEHTPYVATRWYPAVRGVPVGAGATPTAATIYLMPFYVHQRITISDLAARVTTLSSGGKFQLAIYASDPTTLEPTGTALAVTGDMSTTSAAVVSADITGSDVALNPGLYWGGLNTDATAGGTAIFQAIALNVSWGSHVLGSATLSDITSGSGNGNVALSFASTYNTWPDLSGQTFTRLGGTANRAPMLFFKVSAVG